MLKLKLCSFLHVKKYKNTINKLFTSSFSSIFLVIGIQKYLIFISIFPRQHKHTQTKRNLNFSHWVVLANGSIFETDATRKEKKKVFWINFSVFLLDNKNKNLLKRKTKINTKRNEKFLFCENVYWKGKLVDSNIYQGKGLLKLNSDEIGG